MARLFPGGARYDSVKGTLAPLGESEARHAEFARVIAWAQGLTAPDGLRRRNDFRVAHGFHLEIDGVQHGVTHDVSSSGFSALLAGSFAVDQAVSFLVHLACGEPPLRGVARVVSLVKDARAADPGVSLARVSFAFTAIAPQDGKRLERALLQTALPRLGRGATDGAPFLSPPR